MTGRDDDALTWDGDDDPTLDLRSSGASDDRPSPEGAPDPVAEPVDLPAGFTAVGRGSEGLNAAEAGASASEAETTERDVPAPQRPPLGNGALVALGVLGGVYALYAIGWLIGGLRLQGRAQYLVLDVMYQGSLWLAVLAPVLWFVSAFVLTRRSRPWVRFAWLAAGVVVLLPWPFVMIGAVGQ
ncbi:DNA polymerase III subunit gamma/tau [Microbacterium timonense]|uniref:DNA polymerase III subunit gamma/tau n=1 Tax=Microbacterium timonense TaxID=2086576 RepID=UPI000D105EB8|nr:DNA polymerase III subunit gamma/tau [Microbacterium timonense]